MSAPQIFMWVLVGCVGLLSWRNLTAFALATSWLVGQFYYLHTGNGLATNEYFMADVGVITLIYAKTIWRVGPKTYPSPWLHLKCFFLDLTLSDRFIVGIFLLGVWPAYVIDFQTYYKWWLLFWLTVAQFLLAGGEALVFWHRARKATPREIPTADIIPFTPRFGAEPIPSPATLFVVRGDGHAR